jgi:hypothetical protein
LAPEGTQRPLWPLTLHTSCFKLALGAQQAPLGTGRPAFWGMGVAKAMVARETAMARVNFILANGLVVVGLRLEKVLKNY